MLGERRMQELHNSNAGPDGRPIGQHNQRGLRSRRLPTWLTALLYMTVMTPILGEQVGISNGELSVDACLFTSYTLAICALISGHLSFRPTVIVGLFLLTCIGLAALLEDSPYTSWTSLLLFCAANGIFLLGAPTRESNTLQRDILAAFRLSCIIVAYLAIAQAALQFLIKAPWLFRWSDMLPELLRDDKNYNTIIQFGHLIKSNGFFLREPSGLSQLMAIALVFELQGNRQWRLMALFAVALLLSYSGTGFIMLGVGMVLTLPKLNGRQLIITALSAFAVFLIFVFYFQADLLFSRVSEFGQTGSSAYARFNAPLDVVKMTLLNLDSRLLFGHGPGSTLRFVASLHQNFEISSPTWLKLLYEYGLVGFVIWVGCIVAILLRSRLPLAISAILFLQWFALGGLLVIPTSLSVLWVLSLSTQVRKAPNIGTRPLSNGRALVRPVSGR